MPSRSGRGSKRALETTSHKSGKRQEEVPNLQEDEDIEEMNAKATKKQFKVHGWRFSDWIPSPIRSLSADPYSSNLAVGREDGGIEICDTNNKFLVKSRIAGNVDFKLQELCWSNTTQSRGRLFGISLRGFVFEVNLKELSHGKFLDTYGGTPWCMAMSPRNAILLIGCEDGCKYGFYDLKNGVPNGF